MARRISTGKLGRPILGNISVEDSTFGSVIANADVVLEPNGTGVARSTTDFQVDGANALRLADSDNTNYVAFKQQPTIFIIATRHKSSFRLALCRHCKH